MKKILVLLIVSVFLRVLEFLTLLNRSSLCLAFGKESHGRSYKCVHHTLAFGSFPSVSHADLH